MRQSIKSIHIYFHNILFWALHMTVYLYMKYKSVSFFVEVMYPPSASLSQDSNHGSSVNTPIQVNFSIVEDAQDTTLSALIQWSNPPIPLGPGDSYRVTWFMENCQVWEYSPPCDQPADHYAHTVMYSKDKEVITGWDKIE